ncbi:MAG TPA: glycine cleavage T C-terminal barrel domain-containing protein [Gemmatimonadota bacterium]|nr:glycine cleavage T C-terminal barrel domain-containing protein [Gemmatimonadota bacterium]
MAHHSPTWHAAYRAVRETAAVLDLPASGLIEIGGPERGGYLNSLCTNKVDDLEPGRGARAFLLVPQKGRVLADFLACETGASFLVECFGGTAGPALETLRKYYLGQEVEFTDLSGGWRVLSLQGPESAAVLERAGIDPPAPVEGAHAESALGRTHGRIIRWSDTGETGFHIWVPDEAAAGVSAGLVAAGAAVGAPEAWDTAQIESGIAIAGAELGPETIPLEAPTENAISHTKGCYPGQEVIARLWARGRPARLLRGLRFEGDAAPPPGATLDADGKPGAARVTRSAVSPALGPVALAYVHRDHVEAGTRLRAGAVDAEVTDLPMVPVHA